MRASAVSRPTRVARMTNVPVVLSVAPMTSSPGPLPAGIGSPVSIASSTADDALDDEAVDRHLVAGPDAEQVADDDRVERDVLLDARRARGAPRRAGARRAGGWRRSSGPSRAPRASARAGPAR